MQGFPARCEKRFRLAVAGLVAVLGVAAAPGPGKADDLSRELMELSLPEIMDLQVTSATLRRQKVAETAAAVFVIPGEDIRRSGVTSIPEALRLVPGLQVARIDANKWAISARSFNSLYANKLLVLMDGRSVFSNLFPGVFWDVQDTLLEDIDRIEIIRGPAATIWGANAVNGVVNIVTKSARFTRGSLVRVGAGTEEEAFAALRHGRRLGAEGAWRVYAKYFQREAFQGASGQPAADEWEAVRGGFRADWKPARSDTLTVQGDLYSGRSGITGSHFVEQSAIPQSFEDHTRFAGGNLLTRWSRRLNADSEFSARTYYDWTRRRNPLLEEDRHTLDAEIHQSLAVGENQKLLWGAGYRYSLSDAGEGLALDFGRRRRTEQLYSLFLQDAVALLPRRLRLTLGARLEHNSYTGFELHPSIRLLWRPQPQVSFWAAVSRAARTPARFDRAAQVLTPLSAPTADPVTIGAISGNSDFGSEEVYAFELGGRLFPQPRLSLDLALFYNDYDRLRGFEIGPPVPADDPPPAHLRAPVTVDNNLAGETYGAELAANWLPWEGVELQAAYTFTRGDFRNPDTSDDPVADIEEGKIPRHQASLFGAVELPKNLEFDCWLRYVDRLRRGEIPGYLELDLRLAWVPHPGWELALVGRNLLDPQHPEFPKETVFSIVPAEVQREIYARLTWRGR